MPMIFETDFIRYLVAKKTVDDRALNRNVWDALCRALPAQSADAPLHVIEVGAGIGTMLERLIERGVLTHATYTAVDVDPRNIAEFKRRVPNAPGIAVQAHVSDVFEFCAQVRGQRAWDLLIAHAFLDLLDVPRALPQLLGLLRRGGLFYFTINFDGATIFEPTIDPAFDALIERAYHRTMDERITNGVRAGDSPAPGGICFNGCVSAGQRLSRRVVRTGWCLPVRTVICTRRRTFYITSSRRSARRWKIAGNLISLVCAIGLRAGINKSKKARWCTSRINSMW
jgi:SAM-dependent methyltransferase